MDSAALAHIVRTALWRLLEPRRAAGVLQRLNEAARAEFVQTMTAAFTHM